VEKFDNLISFKPTKSTIEIIDYINQFLLENCSLSEYFRNMFTAYTSLPQDMREKIIFKQNYQLISDAINRKKQIFISVQGAKRATMQIAPYCFSRSKEEIHIYLIYKAEQSCKSIKLSKIQSVTVLDKNTKFNELDIKLIEKMQKYGAQFSYDYNEEPIVVKLTPRGQLLLHKIYVHRPIPDKIEGNIYTFNCSHQQVVQYFLRFGGEVKIIAPASVKREMYDFHNDYIKRTEN
jgi:predicted DNA-binding transcriptional regulator YafY